MALRVDTYDEIALAAGKEIADVVLGRVGKLLMSKVRAEDLVARTAQATFIVLSSATGATQMESLAQRLHRELAEAKLTYRERPLRFAASLGVMLPVSTPCNAIVYGSGYIPLMKMVRYGILLDIIGAIVIIALVSTIAPLIR